MVTSDNSELTNISSPGFKPVVRPSLLERQSTGGDIAESGFSFQASYILTRICAWLAQDSFTAMIREAIGDVEARFYVPGHGYKKELIEVKNHPLTPSLFWSEVERFQQIHQYDPGLYRTFVLASAGASRDLQSLLSALQRIRGPQSFYEKESAIFQQSFQDFCTKVEKMGKKEEDAIFLWQYTDVIADGALHQSQGEALFKQTLLEYFPEYEELPARFLKDIYRALSDFVESRRNVLITRQELEEKIRGNIPAALLPPLCPVAFYTVSQAAFVQTDSSPRTSRAVRFDWEAFAGDGNAFAPTQAWDKQLRTELEQTRAWMFQHHIQRRIRLLGDRRLCASLAIGATFSAVRGFSLEMDYRGTIFATDSYSDEHTPAYDWNVQSHLFEANRLIVSIGIIREIREEVEDYLHKQGNEMIPMLHLTSQKPLISAAHTNQAVGQAKKHIAAARARTRAQKIDLFLAGPSYFALFLGHRLNALTTIQCYQYTHAGDYFPACTLFPDVLS